MLKLELYALPVKYYKLVNPSLYQSQVLIIYCLRYLLCKASFLILYIKFERNRYYMASSIRQEDFEKIFKQHLKIETYSKSIDSLFSPRLLSKINYKPYYQRNYVWDTNKASYFIESILL